MHAPVITEFTCDGGFQCVLDLGQPFELEFSWSDVDGNASGWSIQAIGDGFEFQAGAGAIQPPSGSGTIPLVGAPFTCPQPPCADTAILYVLTLTDTTGLESESESVDLFVLGE